MVCDREGILCIGMALLGSQTDPTNTLCRVLLYSHATHISASKLKLCVGISCSAERRYKRASCALARWRSSQTRTSLISARSGSAVSKDVTVSSCACSVGGIRLVAVIDASATCSNVNVHFSLFTAYLYPVHAINVASGLGRTDTSIPRDQRLLLPHFARCCVEDGRRPDPE